MLVVVLQYATGWIYRKFIHSIVNVHLGCFQFGAIMNSASKNIPDQCFSNFNVLMNHLEISLDYRPQWSRSGWVLSVLAFLTSPQVKLMLLAHNHALHSELYFGEHILWDSHPGVELLGHTTRMSAYFHFSWYCQVVFPNTIWHPHQWCMWIPVAPTSSPTLDIISFILAILMGM